MTRSGHALSGFGAEADVIASRRAGFKEHITKPADVRVLLAAIERVTSQRAGREALAPRLSLTKPGPRGH